MAKSNGTAFGVNLLLRYAKLVDAEQALAGKSLVNLPDVNIIRLEARLLKHNRDSGSRADTHQQRRHTNDGSLDELANDLLANALSSAALHHQDGGRTVRNLRRISSMDGTILGEGRPDLAQALGRDTLADTVVPGDGDLLRLVRLGISPLNCQRRNLLVEETLLLRLDSLLERPCSKSILLRPRDALSLGHLLRQHAHGDLAVGSLLVVLEQFRELSDSPRTVLLRHALGAGADANVNHAGLDGIGDVHTGLQTAGALPVYALCGRGDGEAGGERGGAELGGTASGGEHGADGDVLDEVGVDAGALDEGFEGAVEEVRRGRVFEAAFAALGDGRAEGACYDDLGTVRMGIKVCIQGNQGLTSSGFFSRRACFPFALFTPPRWLLTCESRSCAV